MGLTGGRLFGILGDMTTTHTTTATTKTIEVNTRARAEKIARNNRAAGKTATVKRHEFRREVRGRIRTDVCYTIEVVSQNPNRA
jgi:hypothetical protein